MTKALDAAVRAVNRQMNEEPTSLCFVGGDPCEYYAGCGCSQKLARAALAAALPAEPAPEMLAAMAPYFYDEEWDNLPRLYRVLRAHLLGEDDITEDRRPWDEYAGEDA